MNKTCNHLRRPINKQFAYNIKNHLLSAGGTSFTYNDDGYLRTKTVDGETTTYSYSSRGELLKVDLPDGTVVEYVHDPLGRRIAKKVNGAYTEHYLWAGMTTLLAVYDGSGTLKQRFEYAAGRLPVRMVEGGAAYHLVYDQVGTLRAVVDSSGNVVKTVEYDSFGNVVADSAPGFAVPFGFAGGLWDVDTGLVKLGARDYDPDVGRWTSKDPIAFDGGDTDLYGYCMGDPVSSFDPNGLTKVVLYDDDFSRQAGSQCFAWLVENIKNKTTEEIIAIHVESNIEFVSALEKLAVSCSQSAITEMVLMFHGPSNESDFYGAAITLGEPGDYSYITTLGRDDLQYTLVNNLPDLNFSKDAVININTCHGGDNILGLRNLGEAFRDRYQVTTNAYSEAVNYFAPATPFTFFTPVESATGGGALTPNIYEPIH